MTVVVQFDVVSLQCWQPNELTFMVHLHTFEGSRRVQWFTEDAGSGPESNDDIQALVSNVNHKLRAKTWKQDFPN